MVWFSWCPFHAAFRKLLKSLEGGAYTHKGCTARCAQGAWNRNISTHNAVSYAHMWAGIEGTAGGKP